MWEKVSVIIKENGEKTITYEKNGVEAKIESRKRAIPHANRQGVWMHTTYFVMWPDGREKECYTLTDAKAVAEGR